jgi:hypothetical protein
VHLFIIELFVPTNALRQFFHCFLYYKDAPYNPYNKENSEKTVLVHLLVQIIQLVPHVLKDHIALIVRVKHLEKNNFFDCLTLKIKALHSFKMLGAIVSHPRRLRS